MGQNQLTGLQRAHITSIKEAIATSILSSPHFPYLDTSKFYAPPILWRIERASPDPNRPRLGTNRINRGSKQSNLETTTHPHQVMHSTLDGVQQYMKIIVNGDDCWNNKMRRWLLDAHRRSITLSFYVYTYMYIYITYMENRIPRLRINRWCQMAQRWVITPAIHVHFNLHKIITLCVKFQLLKYLLIHQVFKNNHISVVEKWLYIMYSMHVKWCPKHLTLHA